MLDLYFLRHGRSKADDEGKHEGRYDSPLTLVGKKQVQKRASLWREDNLKFDKIIASPLVRARETAEIIAKTLACEVESDPDWLEMDNGILAGLTFAEAQEKYPKENAISPYARKARGTGESPWQLHSRAIRALEKVIQLKKGNILIVAHGGILNAALRTIVGAQPRLGKSGLAFAFSDAGYLHAQYDFQDHIWIIKEFKPGFKV